MGVFAASLPSSPSPWEKPNLKARPRATQTSASHLDPRKEKKGKKKKKARKEKEEEEGGEGGKSDTLVT